MNNGINTTKKRICTVILPVYNSQRYLNRTISSVLQQTLEDFELLAIDDGSVDDSVALLQRWAQKDSRVHVICNPANQGVAAVRNQGIALAQGQYIAFLDSDDTWAQQQAGAAGCIAGTDRLRFLLHRLCHDNGRWPAHEKSYDCTAANFIARPVKRKLYLLFLRIAAQCSGQEISHGWQLMPMRTTYTG